MQISGIVTDPEGAPLAGAVVTIYSASPEQTVVTDERGVFEAMIAYDYKQGASVYLEREGFRPQRRVLLPDERTAIRMERDDVVARPVEVALGVAVIPPFGEVRACLDCGCLVAGGPVRCGWCAFQV